MVITCKCGNESTFFNNVEANLNIESEATDGMIELVNETKAEFTNSTDTIITSIDTSSQQVLIPNKAFFKISINELNANANILYTTDIVLNSICVRDVGSNDRTDQLPSATSLVGAMDNCQIGSSFYFILRNISTTNLLTLDIALGGITLTDVATVPSGTSSHWLFVVEDVSTPTIVGYLINKLSIIDIPVGEDIESIDITDGYLTVAPAAPTNFPTYRAAQGTGAVGDRWTISMWAKQLSGSPLDSEVMYMQHQDPLASNLNLITILYMTTQKLRFLYGNASAAIKRETDTDTFVDNVWHHLMITYDGGETGGADPVATYAAHFKIFIDGVEPSTTDTKIGGGAVDAFPAERVSFGQGPLGSGNDFSGRIDQLAIFNGDQSGAINDIYNNGLLHDLSLLSAPPAHWWKISSTTDSFPIMTDSIGSDNLTATSLVVGDYTRDIPPAPYFNTHCIHLTDQNELVSDSSVPATIGFNRSTNGDGNAWSVSFWHKEDDVGQIFSALIGTTIIQIATTLAGKLGVLWGNFSTLEYITVESVNNYGSGWKHGLITFNGGETGGNQPAATYAANFKIFINGVNQTLTSALSNNGYQGAFTAASLNIGGSPATDVFTDEVAVFNSDIQSLVSVIYNNGFSRDLNTLNGDVRPQIWIRFRGNDINTFPTIKDHGSLGSDFTAIGMTASQIVLAIPPTGNTYNSMSVADGTLTLSGLTSGFPMRRESNNGTDWTYTMYFRANSSIVAGDYDLLVAGLITLKYNRGNKNVYFAYGDATNWIRKTTSPDSILDDVWYQIILRLENGNLGTNPGNLSNYFNRLRIYIDGIEPTVTETNQNNGINPATNQFTSMTIGSDIGHIAWITIDVNLRSGSGIDNIYNKGVVSNLELLSNNPEFWWQFRKTDVSPNIIPTLGSGNLVLTSGNFVFDVYPGNI